MMPISEVRSNTKATEVACGAGGMSMAPFELPTALKLVGVPLPFLPSYPMDSLIILS